MATAKNISKSICDETYSEPENVNDKIVALHSHLVRDYAGEERILGVYERHLSELVDQIEWKRQIISHSCTYDWKSSNEYEKNSVSVGPAEKDEEDFSPEYLGG